MNDFLDQKVVDFNDESLCPRKGIIELTPINPKTHENTVFSCIKDPRTGIWYGIPLSKDPNGNIQFKRIFLTGIRLFNLENTEERKEWIVVQHAPFVLGSPFQRGKPRFKVYNRIEEAEKTIRKVDYLIEALKLIKEMSYEHLSDFSRPFGITPDNNDLVVIRQLMLEKALDEPKTVVERWNNPDRKVIEVVHRCRQVGLLPYIVDKGFVYKNQVPMGSTEIGVVEYLRKNTTLLVTMDEDSKRLAKNAALSDVGTPKVENKFRPVRMEMEVKTPIPTALQELTDDELNVQELSVTENTPSFIPRLEKRRGRPKLNE